MNNNLAKIISSILSASIISESCVNGYFIDMPADDINKVIHKSNTNFNNIAIPIRIELSDQDVEYINFLNTLAQDILKDCDVAKDFSDNPTLYISKNGFNVNNIHIDHKLTQMILAFADKEICASIEKQDVNSYISLMVEKGIINDFSIKDLDNITASKYGTHHFSDLIKAEEQLDMVIPIVVVGVVLAVWAAAIEHALVFNAAALATVFLAVAAVNIITVGSVKRLRYYNTMINSKLIEVYALKNSSLTDPIIIADAYIEQSVNSNLNHLQQLYPNQINSQNIQKIKNLVLFNLEKAMYDEDGL